MANNQRILAHLEKKYDGHHQFVFTGDIDDKFVLAHAFGRDAAFFSLKDALVRFALTKKYDIIISLDDTMKLSFATPEMEKRFSELVKGDSKNIVTAGVSTTTFKPQKTPVPQNNQTQDNSKVSQAAQQAQNEAQRNSAQNKLDQITKIMLLPQLRIFVIFEHPEKLRTANNDDGLGRKIETIAKDWRDLAGKANPDTRSVLIVNPALEEEFLQMTKRFSSLNHSVETIRIEKAEKTEYVTWLKESYLRKNHIAWSKSSFDRVIMTGLSRSDSLYNFIEWIQDFFADGTHRHIGDILENENGRTAESLDDLIKKLDEMIGLKDVKKKIHDIIDLAQRDPDSFSTSNYTMLFLGNPGTGKTEVANIIAKMFWAMDLRRNSTVKSISLKDVQSGFNEGEVIVNMKNAVEAARGGVLFIDEVYQFAESDWGKKAFETLLTEIENYRADLTVIMAGYKEKVYELFKINPGFESRVPIKFRIEFQDYNTEEKVDIFKLMLKNKNVSYRLTPEAEAKLTRILRNVKGNGRGVRNIYEDVLSRLAGGNCIQEDMIVDPNEIDEQAVVKFQKELEDTFVGMKQLKQTINEYFAQIVFNIQRERKFKLKKTTIMVAPRIRFTGAPGTGKTSVARQMAKAFKALGLIDKDEVCEKSASELKGAFLGKAQDIVKRLFDEHRGELLFLDEIYSLYNPQEGQEDSFGKEAVDTLVQSLTLPENERTAVIIAGYKDRVDGFMKANDGLCSRIPQEIFFPNYTPEECFEIFERLVLDNDYALADRETFKNELIPFFKEVQILDTFANARTVTNVFFAIVKRMAIRVNASSSPTDEDFRNIQIEDFQTIDNKALGL